MTSDSRTHHQKSSLLRFVSNYLALLVIYIGETPKYFIDLLKFLSFLNIFIFPSIAAALLKDPTIISKKVRNPISVQNAMPPESIPCAGAAPCAIPCAGILKRKPAPFF